MKNTLLTLMTGSLVVSAAQAAVIATDDFTYTPDGVDLNGLTGGTGWTGGWAGGTANFQVTGGQALGTGASVNTRDFSGGAITVGINDTLTIDFTLIRNETQAGRGVGIQLTNGAGFDFAIGKRQNGGVGLHSNLTIGATDYGNFATSGVLEDITATITYDGTNTSIVLSDANETLAAHIFTGQLTIDGIGLQTLHTGTLNNGIDNLSIDLTTVPEPSSTALLGLGGLALILRRRK